MVVDTETREREEAIVAKAARLWGIEPDEITAPVRRDRAAGARAAVVYVLRQEGWPLADAAAAVGRAHPTTAETAVAQAVTRMSVDDEYRQRVEELQRDTGEEPEPGPLDVAAGVADRIVDRVAVLWGVSPNTIRSQRRNRVALVPRRVVWWVLRNVEGWPEHGIATVFRRAPEVVERGIDNVEQRRRRDGYFRELVEEASVSTPMAERPPQIYALTGSALNRNYRPGDPLWGPIPFPFRCGVTEEGFMKWGTRPGANGRPVRDPTLSAMTPGGVLRAFCEDCDPDWQRQARIEGRCIQSLLEVDSADEEEDEDDAEVL